MNTKALLSHVLLSVSAAAMGAMLPEKRDALCPGTTHILGTYLKLTDPSGTTSYGYLTPGVAGQLADP